jgi:subtilisin
MSAINTLRESHKSAESSAMKSGMGFAAQVHQPAGEVTSRYLVLLREDDVKSGIKFLDAAGMRLARGEDFGNKAFTAADVGDADALVFSELGVAVVNVPPDQLRGLGAAASTADSPIVTYARERVVYAAVVGRSSGSQFVGAYPDALIGGRRFEAEGFEMAAPGKQQSDSMAYWRGYRDALDALLRGKEPSGIARTFARITAEDEAVATWGLQATGAFRSSFSGQGVRVAVLDTGIDQSHPDFSQRAITAESFVTGEPAQDGHGHGTHCIGTACGPRRPDASRIAVPSSYGVAYEAEIFAGKVLNNAGRGVDGDIINGIRWAVQNECRIISMSLSAPVAPGTAPNPVFEELARRVLARGVVIICAAGNDSRRSLGLVRPVGHPANCPSVISVAAVDSGMEVAGFSNAGTAPERAVDISGPGVDVFSSFAVQTYARLDGTSMATPHVAGCAALWAQANPNITGRDLRALLLARGRTLSASPTDVGVGLVQAP